MESTRASTASFFSQSLISQNLTPEEVMKKTKPVDFEMRKGRFLGGGAYGKVYSADIYKKTWEQIAMKVVTFKGEERGSFEKITQQDLVEIEIMSQIHNPFINKLIEYYFQENEDTQDPELVLLQPRAMCDLSQFLTDNYADGGMPEKQAIEFLAQLAIGIKAMHDKRVIHRDLNPHNILIFKNEQTTFLNNQEYTLKITDFGCSRILKLDEKEAMSRKGKVRYMAPEQANSDNKGYNPNVDVYGLGLTVFQMITGKVIDAGIISSRKLDLQCYSPEFIDFLYKLCSLDHEKRPSIDEVIDDPIIQKSQTFLNCLLDGIIPMNSTKIERAIDGFKLLQKEYEAQQQFIDDLEKKFPNLQERIKRPLKNTLPEIGKMFHLMKKVQTQYKDQKKQWQAQYQLAFGNNEQQYLIEKYQSDEKNYNLESLRELKECKFKKEVDANGDIFVGFYKKERMEGLDTTYTKFYGRLYSSDCIKEGYLTNGKFNGETSEYGIIHDINYYNDGDYVNSSRNGYGVIIISNGDMYCGEFVNDERHGLGTYYWNYGNIYEGQWMNSNYHGEGVQLYANGDILKGTWKDDKKHGEFIKTCPSEKQVKITYDMGKKITKDEVKTT
eukprot:403368227